MTKKERNQILKLYRINYNEMNEAFKQYQFTYSRIDREAFIETRGKVESLSKLLEDIVGLDLYDIIKFEMDIDNNATLDVK